MKKILNRVEKAIENAKKLTTKDRKKLKKSTYCGPNRSFPITDCKHVGVAKTYLNRSKFSASTKKKIAACINRKAKKLKCSSTKKAKAYISYSYESLTKEEKKLYNSKEFSSTKKLVEESKLLPGNI